MSRSTSPVGRFVLTLGVAGIAVLGIVAVAPAAFAAPTASATVAQAADNGPVMFLDREHGELPVFLCDDQNDNKQHNNCIDITAPTRF